VSKKAFMSVLFGVPSRQALRSTLLAGREAFVKGPSSDAAARSLALHLHRVLNQVEPLLLGLYWPVRSEFNAPVALAGESGPTKWPLALTFCRKSPVEMHYRAWDGREPPARDECGMASAEGPVVVPDVVLVPCVGFTRSGFRLGYGGGYFDRWQAAHPHVTAVGVAWAVGELSDAQLQPQPHDMALTLIVTEHGVL
jgi:5-formyltetrahydrofolate cyclo-ligase